MILKTLCVQKLSSPTIYTLTALPPNPPSTYYSIIKEKDFQPTSTSKFDESIPSNVEVSNLNNFIAYYVGLASEDF